MKIRELAEKLSMFNSETTVVLSADPEGNRFWQIEDVAFAPAQDADSYDVEIMHPDDADGDVEFVAVLWP